MANDVDIIIGADSSKLQREVRDATQELDRLRTASERMTTSSVEMDRALAGAAKRLDTARTAAHRAGVEIDKLPDIADQVDTGMARIAKGAALTGDAFGSLAGPIGDVGDAFAMMPPQAAAAVVAFTAMIGIGNALITNTINVIDNLDKYEGRLGANETALYSARDAVEAMRFSGEALSITLAGIMAPTVEEGSLIIAGFSGYARDAADYLADMTVGVGLLKTAIGALLGPAGSLAVIFLQFAASSLKARGEEELAAMQAQREAERARVEAQRLAEEQARMAEQAAKIADLNAKQGEREQDLRDRLTKTTRSQATAIDSVTEARKRETKATEEAFNPDNFAFLTEAADVTTERLAIDVVADFSLDPLNVKLNAMKANSAAAAKESSDVWKESASGIVNAAASFATSLTGMVSELASRNTANTRAERLKQFRTMKAAALVEASINTALGVTQSLGSAPFPANIVLGALTLAAGGVQIGLIASQQPNFHRGGIMRSDRQGLAGDERSFSATTRANEAVVLTQQAMGAFAGQLSRANAGEGMGGGMAPVYVMVDGRAAPTRQFARPDPLYGRRRLA
jgi:hypothetical protein